MHVNKLNVQGREFAHRLFKRFTRFWERQSESLPSLFCHERPERIAHGRSFVKSDFMFYIYNKSEEYTQMTCLSVGEMCKILPIFDKVLQLQ